MHRRSAPQRCRRGAMARLFVATGAAEGTTVLRAGGGLALSRSEDDGGAEVLPGGLSTTAGTAGAFGGCAWFGACTRQARRRFIQRISAAFSAGARAVGAAPRAADG